MMQTGKARRDAASTASSAAITYLESIYRLINDRNDSRPLCGHGVTICTRVVPMYFYKISGKNGKTILRNNNQLQNNFRYQACKIDDRKSETLD